MLAYVFPWPLGLGPLIIIINFIYTALFTEFRGKYIYLSFIYLSFTFLQSHLLIIRTKQYLNLGKTTLVHIWSPGNLDVTWSLFEFVGGFLGTLLA